MSTIALPRVETLSPAGPPKRRVSPWKLWGVIFLAPYVVIFFVFVLYPVLYGLWLARHPESYVALFDDPIFAGSVVNTLIFLIVAINIKMMVALFLSGFFVQARPWIKWLSVLFILPWAVPSIPTILSIRFMLNPEWGVVNQVIFKLTAEDGPNWLNDRWLSTILSMIWTLGDFNSVYLLTGGGPADLTHILATLGIRYLRLDQVDLAMATIVCAMPLVLPLVYFMMKRLSR